MQSYILSLSAGQDLKQEIVAYIRQTGIQRGVVLAAVGGVSTTVLCFAGNSEEVTLVGERQIISLTGTLDVDDIRLFLAVADEDGIVRAGCLMPGCLIAADTEIVIAALKDAGARSKEPGVRTQVNKKPVDSRQQATPKPQSSSASYILHTDGASKGNPGPAGIGIALFKEEDLENPVVALGEPIGATTNNVAEYKALIRGLREALLRGVERVEVRTDSQLMAQQVSGKYKVNAPQILPLHAEATQLLKRFAVARVRYVPREQNSLADKLANQGVEQGKGNR